MVMNEQPLKRMKRTSNTVLKDFLMFPEADGNFSEDAFRKTVRCFLSKYATLPFPTSLFPSLLNWQILFCIGDPVIGTDILSSQLVLDVVEEDLTVEDVPRSRNVYCNQCRVVGWSAHPVCRKRYHFIIRANSTVYQKPCSKCGQLLDLLRSRCKECNAVIDADDIQDWVSLQLEDTSHLLHAVVHSNGYGHLLTINGREGGSKVLRGYDIMNFWDRLCKTLAVRKVSVMDISKKYGMEYRLLHAITNGYSWYGDWGYKFGSGSYALTQEAYQKAVETLSTITLSLFSFRGRSPRSRLQSLIAFYQSLSHTELTTLKDLLSFLLTLIRQARNPLQSRLITIPNNVLCAWTRDDIERVEQAMIKVLLAASTWVTRRALKGSISKVASQELLDYCLKHLGGKLVSNDLVVQTRCNPTSQAVEFRLERLNYVHNISSRNSNLPPADQMISDLKFLYDNILHPQTMVGYIPEQTRELVAESTAKLIDCKQFIKEYRSDKTPFTNLSAIHIWCQMVLDDNKIKVDPTPKPPAELVVLPLDATLENLKSEAIKAFEQVYAMFTGFKVETLVDYGRVDNSMTLKLLFGLNGWVRIRGKWTSSITNGLKNQFQTERGPDKWTVDCTCGAKDDDGENMVACDTCSVWQHTRCAAKIDSSDAILENFYCSRCRFQEAIKAPDFSIEAYKAPCQHGTSCRNEAMGSNGSKVEALALL